MRKVWMLASVAAVAIGTAGGTPAGAVVPAPTTSADVVHVAGFGTPTLSDDELFDIKQVAKGKGIPLEQAVAELSGQNEFAAFVTVASERFKDEFTYARWDSGRPSLGVKGRLPASLSEQARKLPMDLDVTQNIGWSESEIKAAGEAVHAAVRKSSPDAPVYTDIDAKAGQVTVWVPSQEGAVITPNSRLASSDPVATAVSGLPAGVTVSFNSGSGSGGLDTVYGGGSLSTCTAAFSVRNSSYADGLLTAEHCGNTQAYLGRSILTFRAALAKSSGDAQWHSSSESAIPYFYYTSGSVRAITSTLNAVPGQSLCKYGKTTSNTCDEVYKTSQCRDDYCNLVMMNRRKADSGDSGGPWFWGNAGYGIHSGWKTYLLINRDMFTPVRSTATGLGLTVKLN